MNRALTGAALQRGRDPPRQTAEKHASHTAVIKRSEKEMSQERRASGFLPLCRGRLLHCAVAPCPAFALPPPPCRSLPRPDSCSHPHPPSQASVRVHPDVVLQVDALRGAVGAVRAGEGARARVHQQVPLQVGLLVGSVGAVGARVRPLEGRRGKERLGPQRRARRRPEELQRERKGSFTIGRQVAAGGQTGARTGARTGGPDASFPFGLGFGSLWKCASASTTSAPPGTRDASSSL